MYILQIFHSCNAPAFPAAQPVADPPGGWGLGVPGSAAVLPAAVQKVIPVCIPRWHVVTVECGWFSCEITGGFGAGSKL